MLHRTPLNHERGENPLIPHLLGKFYFTNEVLALARKTNATWLIDLIALHQRSPQIQSAPNVKAQQCWNLIVNPNKSALLICSYHGRIILTRRLNQTSFPLYSIQLYLIDYILMLADQYEVA